MGQVSLEMTVCLWCSQETSVGNYCTCCGCLLSAQREPWEVEISETTNLLPLTQAVLGPDVEEAASYETVREAIASLPLRQQWVIGYSFLGPAGLRHAGQVARELGLRNSSTVRRLRRQGVQKLSRSLG